MGNVHLQRTAGLRGGHGCYLQKGPAPYPTEQHNTRARATTATNRQQPRPECTILVRCSVKTKACSNAALGAFLQRKHEVRFVQNICTEASGTMCIAVHCGAKGRGRLLFTRRACPKSYRTAQHTHTHISLGHPFYANTERFHIFSDFSQLLA